MVVFWLLLTLHLLFVINLFFVDSHYFLCPGAACPDRQTEYLTESHIFVGYQGCSYPLHALVIKAVWDVAGTVREITFFSPEIFGPFAQYLPSSFPVVACNSILLSVL